jgi:hypothetical protein
MPAWKSWFDLRPRFYCSLAGLLFLSALNMAMYVIASSDQLSGPIMRAALQGIQQLGYPQYINNVWFSEKGSADPILFIAALFLAAGGILSEKKEDSLLLTASLPAKRRQWVLINACVAWGLVLSLSVASTLGVVLGSPLLGKSYPVESSLAGVTIGLWLSCFPWMGLVFLLNSFLHSTMKSVLIIFVIHFIGPRFLRNFYSWTAWGLSEHDVWRLGVPWEAILVSAAIGVTGVFLAALRFEWEDL